MNVTRSRTSTYRPRPIRSLLREEVPSFEDVEGDEESSLLDSVYDIEVPNNRDARKVHHLYTAAIHRIAQSGNSDSMKCIVCGGEHRFEGCPVLNNTEFLRSHYIRFCQQLRCDSQARESALRNGSSSPSLRVSFVDAQEDQPSQLVTSSGSQEEEMDDELDFLSGRR